MRLAIRIYTIVLAAAIFVAVCAYPVRADAPTTIPAWFNGSLVCVIPGVSANVVGIANPAIAAKVANPLYVVAES